MRGDEASGNKGGGHLCLIDFGIAVSFEEQWARFLEEEEEEEGEGEGEEEACVSTMGNKLFFGTRMYASVGAHGCAAQSFRDDLEALVFVLVFLLHGGLPWSSLSTRDQVASCKVRAVDAMLQQQGTAVAPGDRGGSAGYESRGGGDGQLLRCPESCVQAVRELLIHCRGLRFEERPDYDYCLLVLKQAYAGITGHSNIEECEYEWLSEAGGRESRHAATVVDFMDLM